MDALKSMLQQLRQELRQHMTISMSMQDLTALHIAAQNGDLQTAQFELAHGADMNVKSSRYSCCPHTQLKAR